MNGRYQVVAPSGNTNTQVIGTVSSYPEVHKITIAEGAFISDVDNQNASRVAVLGSTVATDLFGDPANGGTDPIGQTIRIKSSRFTVIGVTASKGGTGFNSPDDAIYVPLKASQRFLAGQTTYLSSIGVEAATQGAMTQVQTDITDLLLARHKIADSATADFSVINQADLASALSSTTRTLTLLLAAVAGISLIVGGIGIMNMMLTTVTERTREIGLRKAIGAKRRDVSVQFLVEAVMLTFSSGIIGIILGWLVALALARFARLPVTGDRLLRGAGLRGLGADRHRVRLLPRPPRGRAQSHRSAAIRVTLGNDRGAQHAPQNGGLAHETLVDRGSGSRGDRRWSGRLLRR